MKSSKKLYIHMPYAVKNPRTGKIICTLSAKDDAGNTVRISVVRGEDYKSVLNKLLAAGADLPSADKYLWGPQIKEWTDLKPKAMFEEGKHGWNGQSSTNNLTYLTTRYRYGAGNFRLSDELKKNLRLKHYRKGTLKGAKELADFALKSDAATATLCAGYAALILRFLGLKPFVIYLHGRSKIGKSALQLLAASISGTFDDDQMFKLGDSVAGLMEHAAYFLGRVFPIDEVKGKSPDPRQIFDAVSQVAMTVASGTTRVTHSSFNNGRSGEPLDNIVVMSGRKSLSEYAAECGMNLDDGEAARVIQIPVLRNPKRRSLVDHPDPQPLEEQQKLARNYPVLLRERIAQNHGRTLGVFIRYMLDDHDEKVTRLKQYWNDFLQHKCTSKGDEAFNHGVKSFASLYAAGCIAVDAGLIPATHKKLLSSLQACLDRVENPVEIAEEQLEYVLTTLREALRDAPHADDVRSPSAEDNPIFFRKKGLIVCHKVSLCDLLGGDQAGDLLADYLSDAKLVVGRRHTGKSALLRMTNSERWPLGGKAQAVVFKDPWPEDRKRRK
jgi:hypothetical protein